MMQTKYIHLNQNDLKKAIGVLNNFAKPFFTPDPIDCLPLAYSITALSMMVLVGETAKVVTTAEKISTQDCLSKIALAIWIYDVQQSSNNMKKGQIWINDRAMTFETMSFYAECINQFIDSYKCNRFYYQNYIKRMNQRHYSPDQITPLPRNDSEQKSSKKLRQGGSTTKLLQSTSRYCQQEIVIGDYTYRPSQEIGAGYSSRVYKAYGKDRQQYAIKVIQMKRFSASGLEMLDNQIQILRKLSHPNIIKLHHVHRTQSHTYLITELCKEGDLLEYISRKGRLSEDAAGLIMTQVIEGVKYLMKMGVIHRDLKPANILRGDKIWKIADFGFSIIGRDEVRTKQNVGTPLYMPIESLLKNIYSPESDIFAVGVMYYELLIGITPWECRSQKELIKKLASVAFSIPEKYHLSSHIKYLLQKMCSVDKNFRMQKQQFLQLNMKNFVSLNNFNDPLLSSKELEKNGAKKLNSPAKLKKSKIKGGSKQKDQKVKTDRQYRLGRRKKSCEKVQPRKKSTQKDVLSIKAYAMKQQASALKNTNSITSLIPSQGSSIDRFDIINEKILSSQLEYCRFMYYLIQNNQYIPLPEQSLKRVILIIFKHLVKIIKQLVDTKVNYFKLPNWDSFKQSSKYKAFAITVQDYSEKYEREYLRYLKQSQITVIKDVNQKFSELGSSDTLSLSFYRKLQGLVGSALKDCLLPFTVLQDPISQNVKGNIIAIKVLMRYYEWIDSNVKNFQKYALLSSNEITITKSYKNIEITRQQFLNLSQQISKISL